MRSRPESNASSRFLPVVGVVLLLAGLVVMLWAPEIKLAAWGVMALGVIVLAIALVVNFRSVSAALISRRGRFGAGTTLMACIFLGITLLINGISVTAYRRFDTTVLSQFTLTQQTKDVLTNLKQPVKAICFFVPSRDTLGISTYADNLLREYQQYTRRLSIQVVDPDEHPDLARQYNVTQYQTVVFESQGKTRAVLPTQIILTDDQGNPTQVEGEHAFTSALLEVTGVVQKKVYFVTGHGEQDLSGAYSSVLSGLRDNLYVVNYVDLMANPVVPSDTAVLVLASPRTPLTDAEIKAINDYVNKGGQLLILADPGFPQNINELLTPLGVKFQDGMVIDPASSLAPNTDTPRVTATKNFFAQFGLNIVSYFPGAVGVVPTENETIWPPLAYTSQYSWLETNFAGEKTPTYEAGNDVPGPIAIGVAIANPVSSDPKAKLARIIAIGDSDFASNDNFHQVNNGDLFLNSVNWLAEETKLITITRSALPFRRLVTNSEQTNFIQYSSLALPPLLVLLIGGIVYWYRKS